jgi:cobalt-zinc-cadmium efflux system protein
MITGRMHDHSHHETHTDRISWTLFLNIVFTIIEVIGGLYTNSLSILADALHDLGDTLILTLAWLAHKKSEEEPTLRMTFGYKRLTLGAAMMTSVFLLTGSILIISHAIPRLFHPPVVNSFGMIWLALIGIGVNSMAFLKMRLGQTISEKALTWHLLEDVFGWVAILLGLLIQF